MKPWKITHDGRVWTDQDVRTAHAVAVAELIGDSWDAISPWSGPRALAAWVAVLIASDDGELPAAVQTVYAMTLDELGDCLDERTPPPAGMSGVREPRRPRPSAPAGTLTHAFTA